MALSGGVEHSSGVRAQLAACSAVEDGSWSHLQVLAEEFAQAVSFDQQMREPGNPFDAVKYRLLVASIEQLVVSTLVCAQPHNFSEIKLARRTTVLPKHVRLVQEFLREHASEPVSADQLALLAGVSLRSLYAGFKEYCGVSPMQYLRNLRLDGARMSLLTEPDSSIASVAMRWGFCHLGRFSIDYKQRFGESPSEGARKRPRGVAPTLHS